MDAKKQQLWVLIFSMFIFTLGFGIIIPVMPYFAKSLGANALILGLLMASYSLMQFIFAPYWGKLSDRIGRKPVLAAGLVGFGLAFIGFGFSTTLWMLFAFRIFGGIMSAGIFPAANAFAADITTHRERGKVMGLLGAASGLGMVFGPAICGIVSVINLQAPFYTAGLLALAIAAFSYFVLPENRPAPGKKRASASIIAPLRTPLGVFFVLMFLMSAAIAVFQGIIAYFVMDKFQMAAEGLSTIPLWDGPIALSSTGAMSIVLTAMGLVGVVAQGLLVGKAIDRIGEQKTTLIGLISLAAGLILIIFSPNLLALVLFAMVIGIGSSLVNPCLNTLVSKGTDMAQQGSMMGALGAYNSLGRIVGPPAGGWLYDIDMSIPFVGSALVSAIGAIAILFFIRKVPGLEKPPEPRIKT